jgi:large subunit ribosomal protein L23
MSSFSSIIKRPIISEKSTALGDSANIYAFEVEKTAGKQMIRQAVEALFKVKVEDVRTMVVHGKFKRFGRFDTKKPNWKKALVTLKDGQKIEFFQGA